MGTVFQTRRQFVTRLAGIAGTGLLVLPMGAGLSACSGWQKQGTSSHAGRRADGAIQPLEVDPAEGLAQVNAWRARNLLSPLSMDPQLQMAAQRHADLMAKTGNYGHEFGPGTQFPLRLAAVGFDGSAGENLGVGYRSVEDAIQGWANSPKHREIMARRRYDLGGFAYSFNRSGRNPRYTHFWVMMAGSRGRRGPARML